jgi:hypothetical protein
VFRKDKFEKGDLVLDWKPMYQLVHRLVFLKQSEHVVSSDGNRITALIAVLDRLTRLILLYIKLIQSLCKLF